MFGTGNKNDFTFVEKKCSTGERVRNGLGAHGPCMVEEVGAHVAAVAQAEGRCQHIHDSVAEHGEVVGPYRRLVEAVAQEHFAYKEGDHGQAQPGS